MGEVGAKFARLLEAPLTKLLVHDGEGEMLDRFELISELASGGMATVYLARLVGVAGFQRLMAIKRLHPHLARDPDFVDMFLDEARLAARIHHPHVVPIQEVGQNEHGFYLVMDYIEGTTVGRLLTRAARTGKQPPPEVVLRIVIDTLSGMHAAHELTDDDGAPLEIVHRDVSPQNILLGVDGVARLTDFGVARAEARASVTKTGQLKGKLSYMAPEQAQGLKVDRRADLFATGVVLWEGLSLRRLFKGESDAEVLNKVLHAEVPPLRSVAPAVPEAVAEVVHRALSVSPDQRFATALEFADALEAAAKWGGLLASAREVARCMTDVFGTELTEQRDTLRGLMASAPRSGSFGGAASQSGRFSRTDSKITRLAPPPSAGSPEVQSERSVVAMQLDASRSGSVPAPEGAPRRRGVAMLVLGVGLGAAVVGGALWAQSARMLPAGAPPAPAFEPAPRAAQSESVMADPVPTLAPEVLELGDVEEVDAAPPPKRQTGPATSSRRPVAPEKPSSASPEAVPSPAPAPKPAPKPIDDIGSNPYRQ